MLNRGCCYRLLLLEWRSSAGSISLKTSKLWTIQYRNKNLKNKNALTGSALWFGTGHPTARGSGTRKTKRRSPRLKMITAGTANERPHEYSTKAPAIKDPAMLPMLWCERQMPIMSPGLNNHMCYYDLNGINHLSLHICMELLKLK